MNLKDRRGDQRQGEKGLAGAARGQSDKHVRCEVEHRAQRLLDQLAGLSSRAGLQAVQGHLPRAHGPVRVGSGAHRERQVAARRLLQSALGHDRPQGRAVRRRRSAHTRHQLGHAQVARVLRADHVLLCARQASRRVLCRQQQSFVCRIVVWWHIRCWRSTRQVLGARHEVHMATDQATIATKFRRRRRSLRPQVH